MKNLHFIISQWFKRPLLPRIPPVKFLRGIGDVRICAPAPTDGNIELNELVLICALIQKLEPGKIFEFGTFDGRTTLNLAASSPENTLDLPDNHEVPPGLPLDKNDKSYIGAIHEKRFTGTPFEKKVVQLHGDSARFDYAPFRNQMDFVFVDASHAYRYVMNDSCEAIQLLRDGKGLIVWHDYARWPGVTRALNTLYLKNSAFARLKHIEGTTLAFLSLGLQFLTGFHEK